MFTKQTSFLKFTCASSILTFVAACAQPQPVPIVADMYFDKFSAAQSASNGIDFCELKVEDFTPELVAQIRSNPNYERNLAIWLEECPELALAFADFGTASIAGTVSASPLGGEAELGGGGGFAGGGGTGGGDEGDNDDGKGDEGGDDEGGDDDGKGDEGGDDDGKGDEGGDDDGKGDEGGDDDGKGDEGGDEGCACDDAPDNGISFG